MKGPRATMFTDSDGKIAESLAIVIFEVPQGHKAGKVKRKARSNAQTERETRLPRTRWRRRSSTERKQELLSHL